jgi:hypothetical protein
MQRIAPSKRVEPPAFCPVAPAALVRVCTTVVKELYWPAWLCPLGVREKKGAGIEVRENRAPPHAELPCEAHPRGGCGL